MFKDRQDAGAQLAEALKEERIDPERAVVVALPRGGVPIGRLIADVFGAPLDIVVPRKIGAEEDPEYAIGALTESGKAVWDEKEKAEARRDYLERAVAEEQAEARRRLETYRKGMPPRDLKDKTVILVDDGIATGLTMRAALQTVRSEDPERIIAAVPVAPPTTVESLRTEADAWVVLKQPMLFGAIGAFYEDFPPTSDAEVIEALKKGSA